MNAFVQFPPLARNPEHEVLRAEVRAFLAETFSSGRLSSGQEANARHSVEFSRALGQAGYIGMMLPKKYGGGERSALERYVVTEELLAAGAPVGAHWIADRQSGPLILRFGTDEQKDFFLPKISVGECYFCIGMSEPDSGSDLASVRTTGKKVDGGWLVNGTKLWTSNAHVSHYMIALVRTEPQGEDRHAGLSQFIIDLEAPGMEIRPIYNLAGDHHFNEEVFTDYFVPDERVIGDVGDGWNQVISELAFERSGPERFLSTFRLFVELVDAIGASPTDQQTQALGKLASHLMTLRNMSRSVAGMLHAGMTPNVESAVVKDLGTNYCKVIPELARTICPPSSLGSENSTYSTTLRQAMLYAPSLTIQGGTREILRGMIARGLGLR